MHASTSIDYAASDPIEKASGFISPEKMFEEIKQWSKEDNIVTVISIPLVMSPSCFFLSYDDMRKICHNTAHIVSATQMEDEGKFFQDGSYDPMKEPYIETVVVDGISFNYSDFTCVMPKMNREDPSEDPIKQTSLL